MRVLEGDVEVLRDLREGRHRFDHLVGEAVGIEVKDADPLDALDAVELAQELRQGELAVQVVAVLGHVLGDEVQFLRAGLHQVAGFFDHALDGFAPVRAAEARDGAEGALVVAPFAHLEVGAPGGVRAGARAHVGPAVVGRGEVELRFAGDHRVAHDAVEAAHLPHADVGVGPGGDAGELLAHALGEAPGDDDLSGAPGVLFADGVLDRFDRLFLAGFEEAAGVDDCDVALTARAVDGVARAAQDARDLLGVHLVLRAPEGHDLDFGGCGGHRSIMAFRGARMRVWRRSNAPFPPARTGPRCTRRRTRRRRASDRRSTGS